MYESLCQKSVKRFADALKEGAIGTLRESIELHADMLDSRLCDRTDP